jgi:hypothetical protein
MTRRVACGAAVALATGLGIGAWLTPPQAHYGAATTVVALPPQQPDVWASDVANAAPLPDAQPDTASYQTAEVSPPAGEVMASWQDAPKVQAAVQTTTQPQGRSDTQGQPSWQPAFPPKSPVRVAYNARPLASSGSGREWTDEEASSYRDALAERDSPPPPRFERPPEPRWQPPPEPRAPPMQGRRWDFRPDGSAVPLDDGGGD